MASSSSANGQRLKISYLLWLGGFLGLPGLHRIYNGKITTGVIWLFTLGLLGVGQFVDLFLMRGMAEDYQLKRLKAQYGDDIYDVLNQPIASTQTLRQPTREEKMVKLLKAAKKNAGQLSVTQAVLDTGFGFEEVEHLLSDMVKSGYVAIDNHPHTGVVIYRFDELRS